ncbi:hypothetical protein FNT36_10630 [Hymenobacter setariae]|uniref:Virulence factor n=1 Tax=Hymenobacter setariae TaxID=2594794 RepID=A0A558BZC8_9BACT|nr:hypothetical protein [Hymenobacter setariae]TVT41868.1 hypothetical protein FNT36_10630 [Hymenobacter setariae]
MKRLTACLLLVLGLLIGLAPEAQAQRRYYRGRGRYYVRPVPRRYYRAPAYRPYYGPRYYHAAPYRSYGGRYYYRPRPYYRRPGPPVIIRP